jgi:two-component system, NarL family, nitrate/nitrite response regulator NarL
MARSRDAGADVVLVADDDDGVRTLLSELFDEAGFAVLEAERGDSALALALRQPPAVAVLDVAMPGLSGYEVCHRLRRELAESVSIVMLSGVRNEPYDRVAGLLLGADDYVDKPFDPNELLARVRRLVERSPRTAFEALTPREHEVLVLLAEGYGQPEIAERLVISSKTAASHIQHVIEKLRVHSRAQAVSAAYRYGLITSR